MKFSNKIFYEVYIIINPPLKFSHFYSVSGQIFFFFVVRYFVIFDRYSSWSCLGYRFWYFLVSYCQI